MENKKTLYNFVTIGPAQQKRSKRDTLDYVYLNDASESKFLIELETIPSEAAAKKEWVQDKIDGVNNKYTSYKEIYEAISDPVYEDLLDQIIQKKDEFITENYAALSSLSLLGNVLLGELWDNLIIQGIAEQDGLIAETIINALLINHIGKEIAADASIQNDDAKKARLEQATVMIPAKLLAKGKEVVDNEVEAPYSKALADQLIIATQTRRVKELQAAKVKIDHAIDNYSKDVNKELSAHLKNVNVLVKNEYITNEGIASSTTIGFNTNNNEASGEPTATHVNDNYIGDPIHNEMGPVNASGYSAVPSVEQIKTMASGVNISAAVQAQVSAFEQSTILDKAYVLSKTDTKSADIFERFTVNSGSDFTEVPALISASITRKMKKIGGLLSPSEKYAIVGNTPISFSDRPSEDMFAIILKEAISVAGKYSLHITQHYKVKGSETIEIGVTITAPSGIAKGDSTITADYKNEHYTSFVLFEDGLDFDPNLFGSATGTVKLRNNKVITFSFSDLKVNEVFMAKPNYATNTLDDDSENPAIYGVAKVGVAVFRRIEQQLKHYVLGEIADIETAEAGTFKNRKVKYLKKKTSYSENSQFTAREIAQELSSSSSTSVSEDSQNSSSSESSQDYGFSAGVSGTMGMVDFSADAYADFSKSNSSETSNSMAIEQAKEITETLSEKTTSEISKLRSTEIISEREEVTEVGIDHTQATEDRSSVYQWVDKVLENNVVNYGKRLMYEFMVPEPALNFKTSLSDVGNIPSDIIVMEKPKSPKELGLKSPNDITLDNYVLFASAYGTELEPAPKEYLNIGKGASKTGTHDVSLAFDIIIPEGYECNRISGSAGSTGDVHGDWPRGIFRVGVNDVTIWYDRAMPHNFTYFNENTWASVVQEILPVTFMVSGATSISVNVVAHCKPSEGLWSAWRLSTYNTIKAAYDEKVRDFNAVMENSGKEALNDLSVSSYLARALERRELTRAGIELITEPFKINTAKNNYRSKNLHNIVKIDKNIAFERHASHVKFLEQAFDWKTMAYNFYPYYWAAESKWHQLMNTTNQGDIIFQAFLQAGMSRAVVPVRPGFEKAVMFYMETGLIWNGQGYTLDADDDLYLSIVDELKNSVGQIEETWETRIPTNFRVIARDDGPFGVTGILEI